jgi:very-short-patch-repair endonuclease
MRNPLTQHRATKLRRTLTDSEQLLWKHLRRRQIRGYRFRRQVPVGPYIADFVCLELGLIIEVDGGQHADSTHDKNRDRYLNAQGFRVLRFWSRDVLLPTEAVLENIDEEVGKPPS